MLHQLIAYAKDKGINTEPGFAARRVNWAILCDRMARFTGVVPLGEGKRGRAYPCCPLLSQPELVGGSKPRSHFLIEKAQVVALLAKANENPKELEKAQHKHAFFLELLELAAQQAPYLGGAHRLLTSAEALVEIQTALNEAGAKHTDDVTVHVGGIDPLTRNDWHDWWRAYRPTLAKPKAAKKASILMPDLADGQSVTPASTHPKIRGLAGVGGLPTGDVLVGFDKTAFRSFGLAQSSNAAMSAETATAYSEGLNKLIGERSSRLGPTLSVHWFAESIKPEEDPLAWLTDPTGAEAGAAERRADELLRAIQTGRRPDLGNNRYYNMLLSGASGRVMVREWSEGAFEDLVGAVSSWFNDLSVIAWDGSGLAPAPKFLAVLFSLFRDPDDVPGPFVADLWHTAVKVRPIAFSALAKAVARLRVEIVTDALPSHARIGLVKAYHMRKKGDPAVGTHLNTKHPDPAYHCGRLLALLSRLQRRALGDVGAGVVQRYYSAASQSPALVIGRVLANAQHHLNKLEPGLANWFETGISEITSGIGDHPPRTLNLERQSLFALGYYQQLAELNRPKTQDSATKSYKEELPCP